MIMKSTIKLLRNWGIQLQKYSIELFDSSNDFLKIMFNNYWIRESLVIDLLMLPVKLPKYIDEYKYIAVRSGPSKLVLGAFRGPLRTRRYSLDTNKQQPKYWQC